MKIYKITEASKYLGISINSLKTLANNGKLNSFKTGGEHRRFREDDLDAYMGVKKAEERGFKIAESYFEKVTNDYLKMIKKGLIRMKATTSTTHKCNCEFCTF